MITPAKVCFETYPPLIGVPKLVRDSFFPWLDGFWHFNKVSILFYSILFYQDYTHQDSHSIQLYLSISRSKLFYGYKQPISKPVPVILSENHALTMHKTYSGLAELKNGFPGYAHLNLKSRNMCKCTTNRVSFSAWRRALVYFVCFAAL